MRPQRTLRSARARGSTTVFAAAGLAMIGACSSPQTAADCPPSPYRNDPPLVIAHAGGEGFGPANSLLAIERSLAAGADIIDVDVRITADGVVVAHHDRNLAPGVGVTGNIDELTWAELNEADLRGAWGGSPIDEPVRVPSLAQVLEAVPEGLISVEIKQAAPALNSALCTQLVDAEALGRVYLSSNDDDPLYALRESCPGVLITTTYRDVAAMRVARDTGAPWCAPAPIGQPPFSERLLDPQQVQWSHDHGMAVFTWTVDDEATLRALAAAGVDGVYTTRPDIARRVFDE